MSNIVIVTNPAERNEYENVIDCHAKLSQGGMSKELYDKLPRKVWLDVRNNERTGKTYFIVVDNTEGNCFVEDFATLDGAVLYATGIKYTPENREEWDYPGALGEGGDLTEREVD